METYESRRAFSDKHMPALKRVIAEHFITEATADEDKVAGIDIWVNGARLGVRVRRLDGRFKNKFTLRKSLGKDGASEYSKCLAGMIDYMVYGHVKEDALTYVVLIDLKKWRAAKDSGWLVYNADGSAFLSFECKPEYSTILLG